MSRFLLLALLTCLLEPAHSTDCPGGRYQEKIFDEIEIIDNVIYAVKETSSGVVQRLGYDVYMPANDTETNRPVIMLAHGGGYIDFIDQKSPDIVRLAQEFAQRGYVVISVEYREEASPLSLFSAENMVKAVGRALIDIRDATCYLMDTTILYGNPYGVDPEKVIVGGVSAGAVSFLQAVFLDSLAWVPQQFQEWILEVEPNTQALLNNKYCGAHVLGLINISGALLDTAWIKADKAAEYPAVMHVHGGLDPIVPYAYDYPFGITMLPKLMGSKLVDERLRHLGIRSELDFYPSQGHVPILGINWNALLSSEPINVIFNQRIMNATLAHMTEFIYSLIDCDPQLPTALQEDKVGPLPIFPNPSTGSFHIILPQRNRMAHLNLVNSLGQTVYTKVVLPYETALSIQSDLDPGYYSVLLYSEDGQSLPRTGQLLVVR
jgi:acetyl esterase/lipase